VCAIGVEPNPKHTPRLNDLQASLRAAGAPVLWLHETAADIADGFTTINLHSGGGMGVNDVGMKVKPVGSKVSMFFERRGHEAIVATIDMSRLIWFVHNELKRNGDASSDEPESIGRGGMGGVRTKPKPKIVMKLDIEGAEYRVVPHLLDHDALCALDLVFLEWHETDTRAKEQNMLVARINRSLKKPECDTVISPIDDETFLYDGMEFPTDESVCDKSLE